MKTRIKDSFDTFVYGKDSKGRIATSMMMVESSIRIMETS